jgi:mono/diheme cytochrome c family protein
MTLAVIALLFYITLSNQRIGEFLKPVRVTFEEESRKILKVGILILFPLLLGYYAYSKLFLTIELPAELRVIHPASPQQIKFKGEAIEILGLQNPLRADEEHLENYMKEGANLYFTHCVFCHGPKLDGKGILATGLNPLPADFTDTGTIAQLQESYLFWRISKGGPGLRKQSHPWNSAMPVWEDYLTEEEIWKTIMFLYEGAGVSPRIWE